MAKTVFDIMAENDSERKMADFIVKQKQPYWFKKKYAAKRAREFVEMCDAHDKNYHVSVGGLDSITLLLFLRLLGIDCPAISVSSLEDKSIQKVHKALGVISLQSAKRENGKPWTKAQIIQEFGFPVLSKEIAAKIETLQNPTEKNATVRHAIITGETGEYGGYQKNSRMKMAQKWLNLFAGYENENEGTDYQIAPFKVSSKCCYYLKEKPCDDWAKEHNSVPFLGLMASEGGRREKSLKMHGCNYWGKTTVRSAPFAIFSRQDILRLAIEMDAYYKEHKEEFAPKEYQVDTIIPEIYGEIKSTIRTPDEAEQYRIDALGGCDDDGVQEECAVCLETTGAQRTGCSMCGFGIHLETRPNRFDKLHERNPREWEFWMKNCCTDELTGEIYGWGRVLDYIGVPWDYDENGKMIDLDGQHKFF